MPSTLILQKNILPKQPGGKPPLSGREVLLSLLYVHVCHQFPALSNLSFINANLIFNKIKKQNFSRQFPLAMHFLFASLWRNVLVSWKKECPYFPKDWDNLKCDTHRSDLVLSCRALLAVQLFPLSTILVCCTQQCQFYKAIIHLTDF